MEQTRGDMVGNLILADKYRILEPLGTGGTAAVFLAEHLVLKNKWAVKRIDEQHPMLEINLRESTILKDLTHPMLPRITDIIRQDGYVYIVMDYLLGENMRVRLNRLGHFSIEDVIEMGTQLADVMHYLHDQTPPIIHRDIKPGNLLMDEDNRLHLIDFGSARGFAVEKTDDTVYIGTKGYAAPEQYGLGQSDARTDLYSMGITLMTFLTGISPMDCEPAKMFEKARILKVPRDLLLILRKCIQSMPSARPENAMEVMDQFHKIAWRMNKKQLISRFQRYTPRTQIAKGSNIQKGNHPQLLIERSDDVSVSNGSHKNDSTEADGSKREFEREIDDVWPLARTAQYFFAYLPRLLLFGAIGLLIFYFVMRGLGWDVWPAFGWYMRRLLQDILRFVKDVW